MSPTENTTRDIVVCVVLMLTMSLIAWGLAFIPRELVVSDFDKGAREGVFASSSARSAITAVCLLLIAVRVRTYFTWSAATLACVMSVGQIVNHLTEYAVPTLLTTLAIKATISPATWCEYYLTYRVYRKHKRQVVDEVI